MLGRLVRPPPPEVDALASRSGNGPNRQGCSLQYQALTSSRLESSFMAGSCPDPIKP
jgi:hypothetical protein